MASTFDDTYVSEHEDYTPPLRQRMVRLCNTCHDTCHDTCCRCTESEGYAEDVSDEWICSNPCCRVINFGFRTECFRYHEDRGDAKELSDSENSAPDDKSTEATADNANITASINLLTFHKIPVTVTGDNTPPSCETFAGVDLCPFVLDNIKRSGHTTPTPVQQNAVPIISAGRDLMACTPTDSGKTAAFLIPIINKLLTDERDMTPGSPHVLIVSATNELVTQIYYEAKKFSAGTFLKVCQIYGDTATKHQSSNLAHGCHILVATPGRLLHFLDSGYVDLRAIRFAVLDEADRLLDMGFTAEKIMGHPTMVPQLLLTK